MAVGIASSLGWLSFTILAGLYLTAAKCWSFSPFEPLAQMHAHAHLGGLGFFVMIIGTVLSHLVRPRMMPLVFKSTPPTSAQPPS